MNALPGEDTLIASWRALAHLSPRARVRRVDRLVAAVFPSWAPLNNAIMHGPATVDLAGDAAQEATDLYQSAGVSTWALWVPSRLTDLDTRDTVAAVDGMRRDTTTLVMTRPLTPSSAARHRDVIRTSIDAATQATYQPIPVAELPGPDAVPGLQGWVLARQGTAVVGAWSHLHGTDCGIYSVGTAPEWRRQGLATALMRHLLAHAWDRGARTATVQSTRIGRPLYRSLGFTVVGRYEEWVPSRAAMTT